MLNTETLHTPHPNTVRPHETVQITNQKIFMRLIFVRFLFIVCDFELNSFRLLQVTSVVTATKESEFDSRQRQCLQNVQAG